MPKAGKDEEGQEERNHSKCTHCSKMIFTFYTNIEFLLFVTSGTNLYEIIYYHWFPPFDMDWFWLQKWKKKYEKTVSSCKLPRRKRRQTYSELK